MIHHNNRIQSYCVTRLALNKHIREKVENIKSPSSIIIIISCSDEVILIADNTYDLEQLHIFNVKAK